MAILRVTLGDAVYHHLSEAILTGQFACGEELNEVALAQRLDVSRTPIREALRKLANDGLVTTLRNRHATVVQMSRAEVIQTWQVRQFLETGAAQLAAERMEPAQLMELRSMAAAATPGSGTDWCEPERQFDKALHAAVATASGNPRLQQEIHRYHKLIQLVRRRVGMNPARLAVGHAEHLVILDAMETRDPQQAGQAMSQHIASALRSTLDLLPLQ
jgi:DNA-binding GntR family transcriptional regulator